MLSQPGVHKQELDDNPKNVLFDVKDESCPVQKISKIKGNSITQITEKIYDRVDKTVDMERFKKDAIRKGLAHDVTRNYVYE